MTSVLFVDLAYSKFEYDVKLDLAEVFSLDQFSRLQVSLLEHMLAVSCTAICPKPNSTQ